MATQPRAATDVGPRYDASPQWSARSGLESNFLGDPHRRLSRSNRAGSQADLERNLQVRPALSWSYA